MPRGLDFETRWTEGAWAELKLLEALNAGRTVRHVDACAMGRGGGATKSLVRVNG